MLGLNGNAQTGNAWSTVTILTRVSGQTVYIMCVKRVAIRTDVSQES